MRTDQKLRNGNRIPTLGLGTWNAEKHLVGEAVSFAIIQAGYRHIDCASIYQNEPEIGQVLKDIVGKQVKRDELFITSKLWNTDHNPKDVEEACQKTLADLKLDYLDLYLMHWGIAFNDGGDLEPVPIQQTWIALENLVKKGLVKSIGVSNFTTMMLVDLLTYSKIKPAINQIELHPYLTQEPLVAFCTEKDIAVTAYSPLGNPDYVGTKGPHLFGEAIIKALAKKYHQTPAQILLNWAISRGTIVIPKSVNPQRISENIDIFDFKLTDEEQAEISSLNRDLRIVDPINWWGIPYFL